MEVDIPDRPGCMRSILCYLSLNAWVQSSREGGPASGNKEVVRVTVSGAGAVIE